MAATPPPSIAPIGPVPTTADPTNFDAEADAFLEQLPAFGPELEAVAENVYDNAVDAYGSAVAANSSASTATTQAGIATTQAGIANTKAGEASTSAAAALVSENNAEVSAVAAAVAAGSVASYPSQAGNAGKFMQTDGTTTSWQIGGFPSGTAMLFAQTTAPTGWTKSTAHDNKALRVVSGTAGTGGSVAFTAAFTSTRALTGSVDGTTLIEAQMPSHTHQVRAYGAVAGTAPRLDAVNVSSILYGAGGPFLDTYVQPFPNINTGGSTSHTHSLSSASVNLAVQYVDVIIATKD